jgi:hypothetical protein
MPLRTRQHTRRFAVRLAEVSVSGARDQSAALSLACITVSNAVKSSGASVR